MISCPQCGTTMPTPTGRQARKRYCTEACRKAAWRNRHRHDPAEPDTVADTVLDVVVVSTPSRDEDPTRGGQHRCPHCRRPLVVISVLVPAAGAHIPTPEVTHA